MRKIFKKYGQFELELAIDDEEMSVHINITKFIEDNSMPTAYYLNSDWAKAFIETEKEKDPKCIFIDDHLQVWVDPCLMHAIMAPISFMIIHFIDEINERLLAEGNRVIEAMNKKIAIYNEIEKTRTAKPIGYMKEVFLLQKEMEELDLLIHI